MRRWLVVGLAATGLAGMVGVVGTTAAAENSTAHGAAPDKTQPGTTGVPGAGLPPTAPPGVAPSSVPPLGTNPATPTAPPTSAWVATTTPTTLAPITLAPITVPTTAPTVGPPITGSTVAPTSSFDGLAWFTEIYAILSSDDPFALLDLAERTTVRNTAADVFAVHVLGVHVADQLDAGRPMPVYTVAQNGKAVQVCADGSACTMYGDFFAPTGLLESFTMNGVPIAASAAFGSADVESVVVDLAVCVMQPDTSVSCVILLRSEGASAAFTWEQAMLTAADGRQFALDVARSVFTPSIPDGGFGSARLVFPGGVVEGRLTIPVVSGMTGTPNTITLALRSV